jgi:hypothetical protein
MAITTQQGDSLCLLTKYHYEYRIKKIRFSKNLSRMEEKRNAYKILGKSEGMTLLGTRGSR